MKKTTEMLSRLGITVLITGKGLMLAEPPLSPRSGEEYLYPQSKRIQEVNVQAQKSSSPTKAAGLGMAYP